METYVKEINFSQKKMGWLPIIQLDCFLLFRVFLKTIYIEIKLPRYPHSRFATIIQVYNYVPCTPREAFITGSQLATTTTASVSTSPTRNPPPDSGLTTPMSIQESMAEHHAHVVGPNQCSSVVIQPISAPISTVWSVVRRFDNPQAYKHFVKSCQVITDRDKGEDDGGDPTVGTVREVQVISGLPAVCSRERLEILDDERHVMSFLVIGGEHRLANYRSVTTLHGGPTGGETKVVESYVVDVPPGNTPEDTRVFVETIVKCNLQSLARTSQSLFVRGGGGKVIL